MLPRIPSIVMRRYSTAPGMASAGTCISRSIHGPSRNPMTVSGSDAANSSQTEVRTSFCSWSWSARPTACDTRMEMPEPMPTKTQSRISSGWELVATDASAVVSQKLPMTSVSTVLYSSCRILPAQMGSANSAARPSTEPWVISTCADFR